MFAIKTKALVLRDFQQSDITAYRALRRDEKFQRFYDEEDSHDGKAEHLLQMFIDQAAEIPRLKYQLAIISSNELVGTCGIRAEASAELSIGCEIGRPWQGTGVAREAGKAMIDFGFRELGANRIYAETITENRAAIRLCRLLGMDIEEERKDDRYFKGCKWSTTVMSIYRRKWNAGCRYEILK